MSWLFSEALAAEYSAAACSAGDASAPSSTTATPLPSWLKGKTTGCFTLSRSGMMCEPSTEDRGEALLTSYRAAFRAPTSVSQDEVQESLDPTLDCGRSSLESFARFDRATHSWRTPQPSLFAELELFSPTWPRWGTMRSGECSEQTKPPSRVIAEKSRSFTTVTVSGSWVAERAPTPTVTGNYNQKGASPTSGDGLATWVKQRLPTPTTIDSGSRFNRSDSPGAALRPPLGAMARHNLWPPEEQTWIRQRLPTPKASDGTRGNCPSERTRHSPSLVAAAAPATGGLLSPMWTEWFLGWPIGWTGLEPLEMVRFQQWLLSHGIRWSLDSPRLSKRTLPNKVAYFRPFPRFCVWRRKTHDDMWYRLGTTMGPIPF